MNKVIFLSIVSLIATSGFAAAQMAGSGAPAPGKGAADGERPNRAAMKARFKAEADTDSDGQLSADERKAFHQKMRAAHFAKKDVNGDGQLSADELPRMPEQVFAKLDTDNSGALNADELKQGRPVHGRHGKRGMQGKRGHFAKRMFEKVDTDNNGKITKAEMRAAADRRFAKIDENRDGVITLEEAKAHRPGKGKRFGKLNKKAKGEKRAHRAATEQSKDRTKRNARAKMAQDKMARAQHKRASL